MKSAALIAAFAFVVMSLAGCGDSGRIKELETENAKLKADLRAFRSTRIGDTQNSVTSLDVALSAIKKSEAAKDQLLQEQQTQSLEIANQLSEANSRIKELSEKLRECEESLEAKTPSAAVP